MTETYSGELGEDTKRALLWIFDAAAGWQARAAARADDVNPGSSLVKDDEVTSPYLMSHSVRGALVSAADHLDAFRALVQDAHVVHPRATLTLLRAALENAALAVWLLAPANRNERVLRRLQLQWADFRDGDFAWRLFEGEPTSSKKVVPKAARLPRCRIIGQNHLAPTDAMKLAPCPRARARA